MAPRGHSIERPLLINGYAYLAVSFPMQREGMRHITDRCLGSLLTNGRPARGNGSSHDI
jgi:hypothetical protein